jgi:hypothetical protein
MMIEKIEEDPEVIARSYIDAAIRLQGTQPPVEVYERAVADAERAFRGLQWLVARSSGLDDGSTH